MLLEGRYVLVTGAARGIGRAVAEACAAEGATVAMADRDPIEGAGLALRFDIADPAGVTEAVGGLAKDWPRLDVLINNAAMLDVSHAGEVPPEHFAHVLDTNLTGALRVTQVALPMLRKSGSASVINTASTQSFFGVANSAAYASAKGGLMALTRAMAVDFGAEGIRVNAVAPGFIDTDMAILPDGTHEHHDPAFRAHYIDGGRIPLRRAGTPADCAGAFVFLASDLSRYITGQAISVDGGLTATY